MTDAATYNGAFGGARASEQSADPYSYFRFTGIARAIKNNDYSIPEFGLTQTAIPNGAAHLETLRQTDWNEVDLVVLCYGANDYGVSVPISDPERLYTVHSYQGALRSGIRTLQEAYPHLEFLICSVQPRFRIRQAEDGSVTYTLRSPNQRGDTLEDYVSAARAVAQEGGHLFADLYHTGITEENAAAFFSTTDGTHPLLPGQVKAASAIAEALGCPPRLFPEIPVTGAHFTSHCWAARTGLLPDDFLPRADCTRAQAVTFLWRLAGCPESAGDAAFSDTRPDGYYAAVSWAVEQGITGGYANGCFVPDDRCSRSQIVTFLYRYAMPA